MKCVACKLSDVAISGLCNSCYDDLCHGGDDAAQVAEKLIAMIEAQQKEIGQLKRRLVALGALA